MKLTGITGTGSGKLGSSVFSTIAGQQIVRQYQPVVANPSTTGQVDQRARMKLMSQIAAAMAPVLAFQKDGLVSARNAFIKRNMDYCYANQGTASVTLENLQLTPGNAGFPAITAERSSQTGISVALEASADTAVSRVVYILYKKNSERGLQYIDSAIVENGGQDGTFPYVLPYVSGEIVIWAYGMKDTSAKASAKYYNMNCESGEDIATLVSSRAINFSDFKFTETRGATMGASENQIDATPDGKARVYLTASGNGTVSGAGMFDIGTSVTVTATPAEGSTFLGWKKQGQQSYVSTNASYTFTLNNTTDLIAVFNTPGAGGGGDDQEDGD